MSASFLIAFLFIPVLAAVFAFRATASPAVTIPRLLKTCLILAGLVIVVSGMSLLAGASDISAIPALKALIFRGREGLSSLDEAERTILFSIRLPRIAFACVVGASLSMAGAVFQALLRNPLAEPYILGISGGAAVGAILGILMGASLIPLGVPALAFLGALLSVAVVFGIARTGRKLASNTLLLAGVILNAFFSSVIMLLLSSTTLNSDIFSTHRILFWLMGDLGVAEGRDILFSAILFLGSFGVIYACARALNLMVLGEETAMQLGVDVERTKKVLFLAASLATAGAVASSGSIGFVGLIIPHLMRMLLGSDHRLLIPASVLFGAAFMVTADTIARTVTAPAELPVGVITALCGAPYFIYLLRKKAV
ncbi:MAG: Hemin transport system permease protein HmuU [Syntrophaceae bacterium PtaB.Bin038]|nr:MAG: Hemin transport system permease protein HmuU [Syntrophaceae bacterium PtaB.Bin038]